MNSYASFSELSSDVLTERIEQTWACERWSIVKFVFLLIEMRKRGVHLDLGYDSLFNYCLKALSMERSMAYRRSTAAELIDSFPAFAPYFADQRISISALVPLKKILTSENHLEVLQHAVGMTEEDSERFVAARLAKPLPRDCMQRLPVRVVDASAIGFGPQLPKAQEPAANGNTEADLFVLPPPRPRVEVLNEEVTRVSFNASKDFVAEFERVKAALSHVIPAGNDYEAIFRECFRITLEACARKKLGAQPARDAVPTAIEAAPPMYPATASAEPAAGAPPTAEVSCGPKLTDQELMNLGASLPEGVDDPSRYLPVPVRRAVSERDEGCCAWVGRTGHRCRSTYQLEFDHIVPFAHGGLPTVDNIRLLCRKHNQWWARKVFGDQHMLRFVGG